MKSNTISEESSSSLLQERQHVTYYIFISLIYTHSLNNINDLYNMTKLMLSVFRSNLRDRIPIVSISTANQRYFFNLSSEYLRLLHYHRDIFPQSGVIFFTKVDASTVSGINQMLSKSCRKAYNAKYYFYGGQSLCFYLEQMRYKIGQSGSHFSYCRWDGLRYRIGMRSQAHTKAYLDLQMKTNFTNMHHFIENNINPQLQIDAREYIQNNVFSDKQINVRPLDQTQPCNFICNFNSSNTYVLIVQVDQIFKIKYLMQHWELKKMTRTEGAIITVIHIVQEMKIIQSAQYQVFTKVFPPNTFHYFYNEKLSSASHTLKDYYSSPPHIQVVDALYKAYPQYFPNILNEQLLQAKKQFDNLKHVESLFPNIRCGVYKNCQSIDLQSHELSVRSVINNKESKLQQAKMRSIIQFTKDNITNKIMITKTTKPLNPTHDIPKEIEQFDPLVVILGTSACSPLSLKNVSGIFLHLPSKQSILLDCGINTFEQMRDHFGQKINEFLLSLKVIFLTHIHADHCDGVYSLLLARSKLTSDSDITLILPWNIASWYNLNQKYILRKSSCKVLFTQSLQEIKKENQHPTQAADKYLTMQRNNLNYFNAFLQENKLKLKPVRVHHCKQAFGVVLEHESGVKMSYSGDTTPCQQFAAAANNSTLLIHEATYDDHNKEKAKKDKHSILSEAITMGMQTKSWRTALTHYHCHLYPRLDNKYKPAMMQYHDERTIYCVDHLQFTLSQAAALPKPSRQMYALISKQNIL